jgi:predicted  nucleic acid-binding Zn-ribbon protein
MSTYDKLNSITRRFLLGESKSPSVYSRLQSLSEMLGQMSPKSQRDNRRLEMARHELREIRKNVRRMQERMEVLEEQVKVLEEGKNEKTSS